MESPVEVVGEMIDVDSESNDGPRGKRVRTDLSQHKDTLEMYFARGMQNSKGTEAKALLQECAEATGLPYGQVQRWMYNKKQAEKKRTLPPVPQSAQPSAVDTYTITAKKAISGYNLHNREFFRGKSGRNTATQAAAAWRNLQEHERQAYRARAAEMKMLPPSECSASTRERDIKRLYNQTHGTMKKLQACGCEAYQMVLNKNTKAVLQDGTTEGMKFMANEYPGMLWDFGFGMMKAKGKTSNPVVKVMQTEVQALLTEKWQLSSGTKKAFPYAKLKRGEVIVEGLPEGFRLSKPKQMGKDRLKVVLSFKDSIVVKVKETTSNSVQETTSASAMETQPGCSKDSEDLSVEENLHQIEKGLADAGRAAAGVEIPLYANGNDSDDDSEDADESDEEGFRSEDASSDIAYSDNDEMPLAKHPSRQKTRK